MTKRYVLVSEEDYRQAIILSRMILDAKFELKGDALPLMYKAQLWFANLANNLKNPQVFPDPPKLEKSVEPDPSFSKKKNSKKKS